MATITAYGPDHWTLHIGETQPLDVKVEIHLGRAAAARLVRTAQARDMHVEVPNVAEAILDILISAS